MKNRDAENGGTSHAAKTEDESRQSLRVEFWASWATKGGGPYERTKNAKFHEYTLNRNHAQRSGTRIQEFCLSGEPPSREGNPSRHKPSRGKRRQLLREKNHGASDECQRRAIGVGAKP